MIIVLKSGTTESDVRPLAEYAKQHNATADLIVRECNKSILVLSGSGTADIDPDRVTAFPCVESVHRTSAPYILAAIQHTGERKTVKIGGHIIGGGSFTVIAGPCSIESADQIATIAKGVQGVDILRGGAFKPRTSPYTFQGLGCKGLTYLSSAKKCSGLPTVSEIVDEADLPLFADVDILQVGARNMQNYSLLKALGKQNKPVILKRANCATIEELLLSAEYVLSGSNDSVILCERGIRTFESSTRNTLDVSAIPVIKKLSGLPIIVDPSHAAGNAKLVAPLALASVAAGADGIMLEVHNNPEQALTDGCQALDIEQFNTLCKQIRALTAFMSEL